MFCRATVKQVRQLALTEPNFPPLLFFFQESVAQGATFFAQYWPGVRAVADETRFFYQAFALGQGQWTQMVGPAVWASGLHALASGNLAGKPSADPWQMPGALLVQGDRILGEHPYRHAGDQPDFRQLLSIPAAI